MKKLPSKSTASALAGRYHRLVPLIQQLPPVGSRPLTVAGRVAGWVIPAALQHINGLPGVRIEDEAVYITHASRHRLPLSAVLISLAQALKNVGCLRGWRNESLDVIGEGQHLGVFERAAMRPFGFLTRAVHLNAWSSDGCMWVAKRSSTKFTNPGLWDTLVGGLVSAGETFDTCLLRESMEEAGLAPEHLTLRSPLRLILRMHRRLPEGYQVEDILVSDCVLPESVVPRNQDGEVSEIKLVNQTELLQMLNAGLFTHEAELSILDSLSKQ